MTATAVASTGLAVAAPEGSHFAFEVVNTAGKTKSLGEVPILTWDDIAAARATYGDQGILDVLDGTSLRVSYQSISRRLKIAGKSNDDIAKAQIEFRPGSRAVGASTPQSRAARGAKMAAEKVDGDLLASFMAKVAAGEISEEELKLLAG